MIRRWRALPLAALVTVLATATLQAFAAPPSGADRVEVWPIATRDLGMASLYWGSPETAATGVTIAGELRLPATGEQRVPAVIVLHGDAGAIHDQPPWTDALVEAGFAVFTIDSFTGRGALSRRAFPPVIDTVPDPAVRLSDAYAALSILASHPRIDASRIALMGISSGGRTTVLAAMTRFSARMSPAPRPFAAFVALYPPCNTQLEGDDRLVAAPLRIFIGGADDITPADACRRYVERVRNAGGDAAITVYAGAFHGFDSPPGRRSTRLADVPSARDCRYVERDKAIVNVDTGLAPNQGDRCMTTGFTIGRDDAGDRAVRADVRAFLEATLHPAR